MNEGTSFEARALAGRKGVWRVSLDAETFTLAAADSDESFQVLRVDVEERVELQEPPFTKPFLVVKIPKKKKVVLKLERAQAAAFREWLGPPTIRGLKVALRQRFRWCLAIGILFVVTSIPLPADPEAGIEAIPFDAVAAFLGVSLAGIAILARVWPRRVFFLLDGIWFVLLALDGAIDVFHGDTWWWWCIVVVGLILLARGGISRYQRFASVSYQED